MNEWMDETLTTVLAKYVANRDVGVTAYRLSTAWGAALGYVWHRLLFVLFLPLFVSIQSLINSIPRIYYDRSENLTNTRRHRSSFTIAANTEYSINSVGLIAEA